MTNDFLFRRVKHVPALFTAANLDLELDISGGLFPDTDHLSSAAIISGPVSPASQTIAITPKPRTHIAYKKSPETAQPPATPQVSLLKPLQQQPSPSIESSSEVRKLLKAKHPRAQLATVPSPPVKQKQQAVGRRGKHRGYFVGCLSESHAYMTSIAMHNFATQAAHTWPYTTLVHISMCVRR